MTKRNHFCILCNQKTVFDLIFLGENPDQPQKSKIPLIQCSKCGLIISDLSGDHDNNYANYSIKYYGPTQHRRSYFNYGQKLFNVERKWRSITGPKIRSLLDYGCGTGDFLKSLPYRITRFGFETSNSAINLLKEDRQNNVTLINEAMLFKRKYDVVTMWHSLEHIDDPVCLLSMLPRILTKKGYLFISVPNIKSIQAIVFKGKWFHLDPKRHLAHYSLKSLEKLFQITKLEIVSITTFSFEYGVFGWWQSIFNIMPFDFNMGYKIIKRGERYPKTAKNLFGYFFYVLLAIPIVLLSLILMLIEAFFGAGSVLQLKVRPLVAK